MAYRPRRLRFPLAGLHRGAGYQSQPPYSTPDALNMRPIETIEGRARGGVRPGLGVPMLGTMGSTPVRLLADVNYLGTDDFDLYEDDFEGSNAVQEWTRPSWIFSRHWPVNGYAEIVYRSGTELDGGIAPLQALDHTKLYLVEMFIVPYAGTYRSAKYRLYAALENDNPRILTHGFQAELIANGGTMTGTLLHYWGGALEWTYAFTQRDYTNPQAGWFRLLMNYIDATHIEITPYFLGTSLRATIVDNDYPATSSRSRVGFSVTVTDEDDKGLIAQFRHTFFSTATVEKNRRILVASVGGNLFREKEVGHLGQVTPTPADLTLASDRLLHAAELGQKLYIADRRTAVIVGDDGAITEDLNYYYLQVAGRDWNTVGFDVDTDACLIVAIGSSAAVGGTFKIDSVDPTDATKLRLVRTAASGSGDCSYRIEAGPKVYDPAENALTSWLHTGTTIKGTLPLGCPLIATYRGRIVMAGAVYEPHAWYMSRQNYPRDWDLGADAFDPQRPQASSVADTGQLGQPIRALAPFGDDYLIFGCPDELWILRGDPSIGASLDNFSRDHGIVAMGAWCYGPRGLILFLGQDGMFVIPADGSSPPENLSDRPLPRELKRVDPEQYTVLMAYDAKAEGVHLYLASEDPRKRQHWWFDWGSRGFWPVTLDDDHEPTAICRHTSMSAFDNGVLLGGRDGRIRQYRDDHENDDDVAISSHVLYGPIELGPSGYGGMLQELVATLAQDSGAADWEVHVGETAEEAVEAAMNGDTPVASGDVAGGTNWAAGLNNAEPVQCYGGAAVVKVSGGAAQRWAIETILAQVQRAGVQLRS